MAAPSVRRRRLAAELGALRERAGLKQTDVVARIPGDHTATWLSRIEGARLGVKPAELSAILDLYGLLDADKRDVLLSLARDGAQRGWWQTYSDIISPAYSELIALEADAKCLRSFQSLLLPGLLQTPAYARASISAINMTSSAEDVSRLVEVRIARQSVLTRPEPLDVWAIIYEGALRPKLADPRIMTGQYQRLLDLIEYPSVSIQVIPFDAPLHPGISGPFTVLGFPESADLDVVHVEGLASALYVEAPVDVAVYNSAFEQLRAYALPFAPSADLIAKLKKEQS
ncbi:helix-turn-helix domain-containing protein [Streptomyces sp. NBC_00239]|uniref:helix-turn-helix domain-containing protein n=1 Tax=Streptomyces sp. NBC_00239 TaxID=2903640 RepID=UPI002E2D61A1|nr:helix-turn-helix transcriptional regulator [Streptomyces sp. NBC_00239]